eukprot:6260478-Amphidinium_carterae.1
MPTAYSPTQHNSLQCPSSKLFWSQIHILGHKRKEVWPMGCPLDACQQQVSHGLAKATAQEQRSCTRVAIKRDIESLRSYSL